MDRRRSARRTSSVLLSALALTATAASAVLAGAAVPAPPAGRGDRPAAAPAAAAVAAAPAVARGPGSSGSATGAAAGGSGSAPGAPAAAPDRSAPAVTGVLRAAAGVAPGAGVPAPVRGVARSRPVTVDADRLPATAEQASRGVALPLFPDVEVVADLAAARALPTGGRVWRGAVRGDEGGSVVLVERGGAVTGSVSTAAGSFRIRPGAGAAAVEQLDPSAFASATDGHVAAGDGAAAPAPAGTSAPPAAGDGGPVVRVLVGYTTAAKTRMGGPAAVEADIALAVEQTNAAFATSGISAVLQLAHTTEVATNGPADGTTLSRLRSPGDGWNDELATAREAYGADLTALVVDAPSGPACGVAYVMDRVSPDFAPWAAAVVDATCSTGNTTFTHELGHLFGAAHDRGAWAGAGSYPYSYDWVDAAAGWRTVMAYQDGCGTRYCRRLLRFSNPDQTYEGRPLGAPIGTPAQADNRATLNTNAATVAAFRGTAAPAGLRVTAPTGPVTAPGRQVVRWTASGAVGSALRIELLRDGAAVAELAGSVAVGTGSWSWDVPGTLPVGDGYQVRLTALAAPSVSAVSPAFAVVTPTIAVAAPQDATSGVATRISWSYTGQLTGRVALELQREGRTVQTLTTYAAVGAGGTGSWAWTPSRQLGDYADYRLRISTAAGRVASTSAPFRMSGGASLVLNAPAAGSSWTAGEPQTVSWTATGATGTSVSVLLWKGAVRVLTIAAAAPTAAGQVTWTLPSTTASGDDYRLQVRAASNGLLTDTSDGPLTVAGTALALADADQPRTWTAGTQVPVGWQVTGVPGTAVRLELRRGTSAVVLAPAVPLDAGGTVLRLPLTLRVGEGYALRASVLGNPFVHDTADGAVTVVAPSVQGSAPARLVLGAPAELNWSFSAPVTAPVRLELVADGRLPVLVARAVPTTEGTGRLTWVPPLPLPPASGLRLRVTAVAVPGITAVADEAVELVRPQLTLVAPTAGAALARGSRTPVTWQWSDGAAAPVRVTLLRGTTAVLTTAGTTAADGSGRAELALPSGLAPGTYVLRVRPTATSASAAWEATAEVAVV